MKVLPVSFSLNSKNAHANLEHRFLYTKGEFTHGGKYTENYALFAGFAALAAVVITLLNLGINKKPPKTVFVV